MTLVAEATSRSRRADAARLLILADLVMFLG